MVGAFVSGLLVAVALAAGRACHEWWPHRGATQRLRDVANDGVAPVDQSMTARFGAAVARRDARQRRDLVASLPVAVELMGAAVRSGLELLDAMTVAAAGVGGPFASDVARVSGQVGEGATTSEALLRWRTRRRLESIDRLVLTCEVGRRMGAGLDLSLESLAAGLRLDEESAANRRMASTQSLASAAVMVLLPVVVIVAQAGSLFGSAVGWGCVAAAVALDGIGALWMHRLIRAAA